MTVTDDFEREVIAFLTERGYRVTKAREDRAPRRLAGRKHRDCIDHHRMDGYGAPLCVLSGQDAGDVLAFARDVLTIAASAGDVLTAARMRDFGARVAVAA